MVDIHASWCCGSDVLGRGGIRLWWGAIAESVCSRNVGSSQCGAFRRRMVCAVWHESAMCVSRYSGRVIFVFGKVPDAVPFVCFKASIALRW